MNYSHFSSLGYAVNHHSGYRIVNPSKQFSGSRKTENYSSSVSNNVHIYEEAGDPTTFSNYLRAHPISFVWFFAEWCGHCKVMADDFAKTADALSDKIFFVKIDADQQKEISAKYQIEGYPTLKLFRDGKFVEDYEGPRKAASFMKWLNERA